MSQFKRFNSSDNTNWNTGDAYPAGTLTWDMDNGLRLHDGNTSGGNSVGGSSFSGSYTDLTDKPSLATVATSGNYYDLSNTPTLFSGEYNALTGKPTLFSGNYDDLTDKPTIRIAVATGSGPGGNLQADSLALAGLNPVTDIPSTWGGDLILQGGVGGANGDLYGEVRIKSGQIGANYEWHFTTDKKIKLPAGGDIVDSTGASVMSPGPTKEITHTTNISAVGTSARDGSSIQITDNYQTEKVLISNSIGNVGRATLTNVSVYGKIVILVTLSTQPTYVDRYIWPGNIDSYVNVSSTANGVVILMSLGSNGWKQIQNND